MEEFLCYGNKLISHWIWDYYILIGLCADSLIDIKFIADMVSPKINVSECLDLFFINMLYSTSGK